MFRSNRVQDLFAKSDLALTQMESWRDEGKLEHLKNIKNV
jgi:hypothetical protein